MHARHPLVARTMDYPCNNSMHAWLVMFLWLCSECNCLFLTALVSSITQMAIPPADVGELAARLAPLAPRIISLE